MKSRIDGEFVFTLALVVFIVAMLLDHQTNGQAMVTSGTHACIYQNHDMITNDRRS